jgi:hypothetical protein
MKGHPMPQIFIMLSPYAQQQLKYQSALTAFVNDLDDAITPIIAKQWNVLPEDVTCSAANLIYSRGEVDVQIEIRYLAEGDEKHPQSQGKFVPSLREQERLSSSILDATDTVPLAQGFRFSVWCKAYHGGSLESEGTRR